MNFQYIIIICTLSTSTYYAVYTLLPPSTTSLACTVARRLHTERINPDENSSYD